MVEYVLMDIETCDQCHEKFIVGSEILTCNPMCDSLEFKFCSDKCASTYFIKYGCKRRKYERLKARVLTQEDIEEGIRISEKYYGKKDGERS